MIEREDMYDHTTYWVEGNGTVVLLDSYEGWIYTQEMARKNGVDIRAWKETS